MPLIGNFTNLEYLIIVKKTLIMEYWQLVILLIIGLLKILGELHGVMKVLLNWLAV
jgi:hypothetical protein